jgi:hypothetical protein
MDKILLIDKKVAESLKSDTKKVIETVKNDSKIKVAEVKIII